MIKVNLVEYEDRWDIDIPNATVIRCIVDHSFSIEIADNEYTLILGIECEFTIEDGQSIHQLDIEDKSSLIPGFSLLNEQIKKIVIQKTGMIEVMMSSSQLIVKPHQAYEAWQLWGKDGLHFVCMPGGDVAMWDSA